MTDLYIAEWGDDKNVGNILNPFENFDHAMAVAFPGDRIISLARYINTVHQAPCGCKVLATEDDLKWVIEQCPARVELTEAFEAVRGTAGELTDENGKEWQAQSEVILATITALDDHDKLWVAWLETK